MRMPPARFRRTWTALGLSIALFATGCAAHTTASRISSLPSSASAATRTGPSVATGPANSLMVQARREPLTTDGQSTVVHDTETMALAAHSGRLFAATDQWMYAGPHPAGQVLVKDSTTSGWRLVEQTQSLRVQALDSFPIPADQGLGAGHSLLITQAIVNGQSEIQWLLDGATSFAANDSFPLASIGADVRSFGAHESGGVWAVYAGVRPTGILRGTWSPVKHTLVFDPTPELAVARPGSRGLQTQKVTGFADCAGASYVTINTKLFRRNDGDLPSDVARWVLVYEAPPVGPHNSGLRGLTCATHHGSPSLLVSTEGNGNIYRIDHLPTGQLAAAVSAGSGLLPGGMVPTLEFSPIGAIHTMLTTEHTPVPTTGRGSIVYVIAAYNNGDFQTINGGATDRRVFGFEWAYARACPATRTCGPTSPGGVHFDATACFAIRTDSGAAPGYSLRCLSGPTLTPSAAPGNPIRSGQAFVSIRTIVPSPFGDGALYYGGYDCNFYPADGTAWVATSTLTALHLAQPSN